MFKLLLLLKPKFKLTPRLKPKLLLIDDVVVMVGIAVFALPKAKFKDKKPLFSPNCSDCLANGKGVLATFIGCKAGAKGNGFP